MKPGDMDATTGPLTRPQAIATAQRMAEGGWQPSQIRDYLAARGVDAHVTTVARWADPTRWAAKRQRDRDARARDRRERSRGRLGAPHHGPDFKLARMRGLHAEGVTAPGIAAVIRYDYGDTLSERQVRTALRDGRYPRRAIREATVTTHG